MEDLILRESPEYSYIVNIEYSMGDYELTGFHGYRDVSESAVISDLKRYYGREFLDEQDLLFEDITDAIYNNLDKIREKLSTDCELIYNDDADMDDEYIYVGLSTDKSVSADELTKAVTEVLKELYPKDYIEYTLINDVTYEYGDLVYDSDPERLNPPEPKYSDEVTVKVTGYINSVTVSTELLESVKEPETEEEKIEKAKSLIQDFCDVEYESDADFSDLHSIPLAYTESDAGEPIQVVADLLDWNFKTYFDDKLVDTTPIGTLKDLEMSLDFDTLVAPPEGYDWF
jgi:hypothetical protein